MNIQNIINKISSKLPNTNSDWIRVSVSLFLTGILFIIVDMVFMNSPDNNTIMSISSICMSISLFCFPYINKEKLPKALIKFGAYILYLIVTISTLFVWLSNISQGNINLTLSVIVAIMVLILINITLKPLFQIISILHNKIHNSQSDHISAMFKNIFANIGIVTAFLISILTIIKTVVDILKNVNVI